MVSHLTLNLELLETENSCNISHSIISFSLDRSAKIVLDTRSFIIMLALVSVQQVLPELPITPA